MPGTKDIRSFFGAGNKQQPPSALSALRDPKVATPAKNSPAVPVEKNAKKRQEKITSSQKKVHPKVEELFTDGEDPIPKSVRKARQTTSKRKPVVSSDSEEGIIRPRAKISKPIETPPSSEKKKSRRRVRISSESENSSSQKNITDSEEVPSESDEESIPTKKSKKSLPSNQKKLVLTSAPKSDATNTEAPSSNTSLRKVSAEDFFSCSGSKQPKSAERRPSVEFIEKDTAHLPVKNKQTTPQGQTPKSALLVDDDEFLEKDNTKIIAKHIVSKQRTPKKPIVLDEPMSISAKKNTPAKKKDTPKKTPVSKEKDFDNEFVESEDDDGIAPKKTKISPSTKENHPTKKAQKNTRKTSNESSQEYSTVNKLPTFIAGTTPSAASSDDRVYELPWVDKYKPKSLNQLVGQHGDKSPMNKLLAWLKDWAKHNLGEGGKIKKPKPAPWQQGGDGTAFKAALLSGSPGIGKTTCAQLASQTLGLSFVEMNASDVRNKKHLEAQVAQLTGSHHIGEYFGQGATGSHDDTEIHHILIMDEVDGMSGNEDRAGIAELIQLIKDTKIPIICICNDRSHPKIRSLVNYCYDIRFPKPRVEQIRARVMSIAAQEKMKIDKNDLDELIELSGHDVRQTIYNLQMRSTSSDSKIEQKDCAINTFEAARKLLDTRSSWMEKQEMFYVDYGIMPLFVQENYLNMKNKNHTKSQTLKGIREAADLISMGDTVDRCIRSTGAWKLLNEQAMFSSILPSIAIDGHLSAMIQFPSWLGKNSTAGKRQRLMRQLACHAHLKISADTHSLVTDYVPMLRHALTDPLIKEEADGVPAVVATMTEYDLLKDDAEAIGELAVWPGGKIDPASKIQPKVKAALTRALNKEHRMLPYHLDDISKGRKKAAAATELEIDEEGNLVERVDGEEPEEEEEEETSAPVTSNAKGSSKSNSRGGSTSSRGGSRGGRGKK